MPVGTRIPGGSRTAQFTLALPVPKELTRVVVCKVEHRTNVTRELVERKVADSTSGPVVLDESNDGGLIGHATIDEILLRPRRNYERWQTSSIAATRLVSAGHFVRIAAAEAWTGQRVAR